LALALRGLPRGRSADGKPKSGIQDAKLVRLEVGEPGWPLLEGV